MEWKDLIGILNDKELKDEEKKDKVFKEACETAGAVMHLFPLAPFCTNEERAKALIVASAKYAANFRQFQQD